MARSEAKLLYPGLAGFYTQWSEIAFTLVRIVVGVIMIMHVWGKFKAGPAAVAVSLPRRWPWGALCWATSQAGRRLPGRVIREWDHHTSPTSYS